MLRMLAACMADWWLPRRVLAQRRPPSRVALRRGKPERRVIVVTFGGGARYEDTLAPEGWINIPHLTTELVPQGLVYPMARYEGLTGMRHHDHRFEWNRAAFAAWCAGIATDYGYSVDNLTQVMETEDRAALDEWIANWSDIVDFEVIR